MTFIFLKNSKYRPAKDQINTSSGEMIKRPTACQDVTTVRMGLNKNFFKQSQQPSGEALHVIRKATYEKANNRRGCLVGEGTKSFSAMKIV